MEAVQEKLLDAYASELAIAATSFELMGKLLDVNYLKRRVELLKVSEFFIYGGGYLGIQFYYTASKLVKVLSLIDKKRKLAINIPDIPVLDVKEFKDTYRGEKVIIASIRYYNEIQNELASFVPQNQIMYLGEFLGGILK